LEVHERQLEREHLSQPANCELQRAQVELGRRRNPVLQMRHLLASEHVTQPKSISSHRWQTVPTM
jgi:hypothetical protein